MVAKPKEGDESVVLPSCTLKYDWRSSSQGNIGSEADVIDS